jgi:LeuA allosteric (dimerisation) domain
MSNEVSTATPAVGAHLHLARWSASMGSKVNSRGSVLIESGDHRWEASAKGNGPVDALFRAVDLALQDVLGGHPRLLNYDVHAVAEGPDAEGRVTVRIAPPADAAGARSDGTYEGVAQGANIVVASIEAYIEAIEQFLREEHWAGATEAAGNNRAAPLPTEDRPEFDDEVDTDQSRWWT